MQKQAHGSDRPSHVVTSMGVGYEIARNSVRISLSQDNEDFEIDRCVRVILSILEAN